MSDQEPEGSNSSERHLERTLDQAVTAAVLQAAGPTRRQLLVGLGAATLSALIAETFPLARAEGICRRSGGQAGKDGCQHRIHPHYVWNSDHHGRAVRVL